MCDIRNCENAGTVMVENGAVICDTHNRGPKAFVCKFCHIPCDQKGLALLGWEHKKSCRRKK